MSAAKITTQFKGQKQQVVAHDLNIKIVIDFWFFKRVDIFIADSTKAWS